MPLGLIGNGQITGLSAGGLPDATVVTADIADGAITPAKTQLGALPSMVRLNTANGYGSAAGGLATRRFTTNSVQGSDISYNSGTESTLGAVLTINTNGVYSIAYSETFSSGGNFMGITLNASSGGTSVSSLTAAEIIAMSCNSSSNAATSCAGTLYLAAGAVIRPQTAIGAAGTPANSCQFTITRVA